MQNELSECVDKIKRDSDIAPHARVVGQWVWVEFPNKPAPEIRRRLVDMGFRWNRKRNAWQNPCGHFTRAARGYDPRDKYGQTPIEDNAPARRDSLQFIA